MFVFIPALAAIYAGVGVAMLGALGYETATGRQLISDSGARERPASAAVAPSASIPPSAAEIGDFARAHASVVDLQDEYNRRIVASDDPEEIRRLRSEALSQMRASIAGNGLTVPRYNEIYVAASSDEVLRQQVVDQIATLPTEGETNPWGTR